jgi:multiple sugar transport system permease protein/putative aldouronate transport system permease protein
MKTAIQISAGDKVFYFFNGLFLGVMLIITLYPVIFVVSSSFSGVEAVTTGKVVLWPVDPGIEGYIAVFRNQYILSGYFNSFFYTVAGISINVSLTLLAGFALSRREIVGYTVLNFFFAFTMWFSGGMKPNYLLVKNLGILNTRWAMLLPGAISIWNLIITRSFFQNTIPNELYESASLDGCGYFRYFFSIVLPLSGAITAVISMFYAVGHWNAYFDAFLYLSDKALFPLQIILRDILIQNSIDIGMLLDPEMATTNNGLEDLLKYSLIMVACVPVWCIYPFVLKYFVKGVMVGSIKG